MRAKWMIMATRRALFLTVKSTLLISLAGCGADDLPDYTRLGGLRILALRADTPEVNPGATVQVTAVVSDLPNSGSAGERNLTFAAEGCIDPGVGLGASPSCAGRPDRVSLGAGAIPGLGSPSNTFTGEAPALSVVIPPAILAGRSPQAQYNGVAYLVFYTVTATDPSTGATSQLTSFRRILASTRAVKNSNPVLNDVLAGNQGFQAYLTGLSFGAGPISLVPALGSGSSESYTEKLEDGSDLPRQETLTTTWFLSDGDMKRFRTDADAPNTWTPPASKPSRPGLVFLVVTRDGRGGEAYRKFEL